MADQNLFSFHPLPPPARSGFLSSFLAGAPASLGWCSLLVAGQRRGQLNLMLPGISDMGGGGLASPSPAAPCSLTFCSVPFPSQLDW